MVMNSIRSCPILLLVAGCSSMPPDEETALVMRMMSDPDPNLRKAGANGMLSIRLHDGAIESLIRLLDDPDWEVKAHAAYALDRYAKAPDGGRERALRAVPKLAALLGHREPMMRHYALLALERFGEDAAAAIPALESILKKGERESVLYAVAAASKIGPRARRLAPRIIEYVRRRDDIELRSRALYTISDVAPRTPRVKEEILAAVSDEDLKIRSAGWGCVQRNPDIFIEHLRELTARWVIESKSMNHDVAGTAEAALDAVRSAANGSQR